MDMSNQRIVCWFSHGAASAEQERLLGVALCKMSGKKFEKLHPEHFNKMKRDHEAGLVKWSVDSRGDYASH